ncbi:50S ribosomal protein L30e-like protein [Dichotomopilus funicola]|uniref:50S ribosomal protein L30e-like protein n=1 Tax=Dichotomopilus funicola TaxID=1934379 RepID=A0AAN6VAS3_9PEZI|nr:50S ribosomal protein L30e-like protein [Dichotomopilus funicola]
MAVVDVVDDKKLKKEKKSKDKSEKKDKKRSEAGGVTKEKKDKKKDKAKQDKLARALDAHLQADAAASFEDDNDAAAAVDPEDIIKPAEELVPFALPLADDKVHKKIYKLIKKGAKLKSIHRGVKECEKAIKKCPPKTASSKPDATAPGLVIIAGDISPMDVIMHFPVLCEEHGVPYLYVRSRADLGVAACTKRATSVVMLKPEGKKSNGDTEMDDADDKKVSAEEYLEAWTELAKTADKQWKIQVQPWVKGTHPLQIEDRERQRQAAASA